MRALARALDLPVWSKPAEACLASRIAYDEPVTADKLRQVAAAEDVLRELGLGPELRVRHHGDVARIELPADEVQRAAGGELREVAGAPPARPRLHATSPSICRVFVREA